MPPFVGKAAEQGSQAEQPSKAAGQGSRAGQSVQQVAVSAVGLSAEGRSAEASPVALEAPCLVPRCGLGQSGAPRL